MEDVCAIVVHHNSVQSLQPTLHALVNSGLSAESILVVDNSSSETAALDAAALCGSDFRYLRTDNRGYAAAVNRGLTFLNDEELNRQFVLVSTHESIAESGAVRALRDCMSDDPGIAVAGPTLMNAELEDDRVWSLGGKLTRFLKLPRHFVDDNFSENAAPVDRDWLDGAFTLYRTSVLREIALEESYFLYFEETDLHTRLKRSRHRVVWVPSARVSQRSSGIPPRLLGRNLFLFNARLFSRNRGRAAVVFELARFIAKAMIQRNSGFTDVISIYKGWRRAEAQLRNSAELDDEGRVTLRPRAEGTDA